MNIGATRAFNVPPAVRNILIGGDSLSVVPGFPAGPGYPAYLQALMPTATITINAVPGRKTFDLYAAMHAQILLGGWTDIIIMCGVNDVSQDRTAIMAMEWLNFLYADAWQIQARMTGIAVAPWFGAPSATAPRKAETVTYNTMINQHLVPWRVINPSPLGNINYELLPAYDCGDGVHFSAAGQEALAQLVYNGLQ